MTTFAPTFTPRWKGKYIAAGVQHTVTFRGARGSSFSTMDGYKDRAREVFDAAHGNMCEDFTWISAEVAMTDSDVFLPATTPTVVVPGTQALSDYSPKDKISAMTLSGKAEDGRARFSMFGLLFGGDVPNDIGADGLVRLSEFAALGTIISTANTYFYAASGALAKWHSIATFKENDHLLKLVRRGTIS